MNKHLDWTGERIVTTVSGIGVVEHLHRYAIASKLVRDKVVLDLASGEGYGSNILAKDAKYVIGVDISEDAISFASKKYPRTNLCFRHGSVTNIPQEDKSIDIVVSFETLEHIIEQEIMFKEIKRVLKRDGLLIISTPEKSNYQNTTSENNPFHLKELHLNELENLMKEYFTYYKFLFQKSVYGTLIAPEFPNSGSFSEFKGNFSSINYFRGLQNPVFNLCIASDLEIPNVDISYFDAQEYYDLNIRELQEHIKKIINSKYYRIGKFILNPFKKIKTWVVR